MGLDPVTHAVTAVATEQNVTITVSIQNATTLLQIDSSVITRLNVLELYSYMITYIILHNFPEVQTVQTHIDIAQAPYYHVSATRTQAFAFPPGEIEIDARTEASMLYRTAVSTRMIHNFDVQFIADELQQILDNPTIEAVQTELEGWVSGVTFPTIQIQDMRAFVVLDVSELLNMLFSPDELAGSEAAAFIEDHAKMNVVSAVGSVMDRFPQIEAATVIVQIQGEVYVEYHCTRAQFASIGRDAFITAVTLDDYNRILDRLRAG
jgi:hypothetical protein